MNPFELEQQVWEMEGYRMFFVNPVSFPTTVTPYVTLHGTKEPALNHHGVADRLIECVGLNVPFIVVDTSSSELIYYNDAGFHVKIH